MKWIAMFAALLLPAAALGQVNVEWVQDTAGVAVALDAAENVYTVNYIYNPGGDIVLTKRDTNGVFLWDARYDQTETSKWEKATWVATDQEGNAIVSGTLMSGYSNPVNAASILMKFNPSGELLWRTVYESAFDGSYTKKCLVDENDNIYVLGMGSGPPGFVTKVRKFAPDGIALWTYYDAAGIGAPVNFKFTPDGGIVITGRAIFGSINGYAKIDRNGNPIWSHPGVNSLTVGDAEGDNFGNTYLVHGEYVMNGGTVIRKLTPSGSLLWANTYPLSGFRLEIGTDDRPVVCGFPDSNTSGSSFIKVDGDGGVVWTNPDADGPLSLLLHAQLIMDSSNNVYLAAGTLFEMAVCKVNSDGTSGWTMTMPGSYANALALGGNHDVYVIGGTTAKLEQESPAGVPDWEEHPAADGPRIRFHPNPVSADATVRYLLPSESQVALGIYDLEGRQVAVLVDRLESPGDKSVAWNARALAGGIYCYRLQVGNTVKTGKFSVLR